MITSNDFRNGITIELDGQLMTVVEFLHVKPGKGSAFVRTKLKNVRTGFCVDKTFKAGEKVTQARIEKKSMQFLYANDGAYTFMDNETFDQIELGEDLVGDAKKWMIDGMEVHVLFHERFHVFKKCFT